MFSKNDTFKVVCILPDSQEWSYYSPIGTKTAPGPVKGDICTVTGCNVDHEGVAYYHLLEWPEDPSGIGWEAAAFKPLNPYSNSVSKELAKEAVKERVETDQPVKQLEQAN